MTTIDQVPTKTTAFGKFVEAVQGYERWGLAVGVGLQLTVLVGMIALRAMVLLRGDVFYVRVQPVDPRDLMRGDYVILGYEFSRLPGDGRVDFRDGNKLGWNQGELRERTIYVSLEPEGDGKHWRAARFSLNKPMQGPFLKGKMTDFGTITYGIESYFVQEGKGREYEDAVRSRQLSAEISVTPEGEAGLRGLHILR